jgi:hypothetical protein
MVANLAPYPCKGGFVATFRKIRTSSAMVLINARTSVANHAMGSRVFTGFCILALIFQKRGPTSVKSRATK